MNATLKRLVMTSALSVSISTAALAGTTTTTTFDGGNDGWSGPAGPGGTTIIEPAGGNPGAHMRTQFNDFGITFRNNSNTNFVQDLSGYDSVTISIDTKVELVNFFGQDVSRPWFVEFRDFDNNSPFPWDSVWFKFTDISAAEHGDWTRFSVTFDPRGTDLPGGWGGYGDEDPNTFEPILPAGRNFTDLLSTYDEIAFSTLEPGFFFGFTDFDVRIDNISITVPEPSTFGLFGVAMLGTLLRRR